MPKNDQTTAQLHSSHTLVKACSIFSKPGFSNTRTLNFQMFKLVYKKLKSVTAPTLISPLICLEVLGLDAMILVFWMLSFKPAFLLSSSSRSSLVPFHFLLLESAYHLHIGSCWYFSQPSWFQFVLHPAQHFTWLTKQGDHIQPWHTPFSILNQSLVPCLVLTDAFWPTYKFLWRQVRWSGIPISLRIFHSLLWSTVRSFSIVNEAEVDVFLELLLSPWSHECWQFDLWFLYLFKTQLIHLEFLSSCTAEA